MMEFIYKIIKLLVIFGLLLVLMYYLFWVFLIVV